jgi:hypothetical protein
MAKFDKDIAFAERFRQLVKEKGWDNLNRIDIGKKIGTSGACATYYMNGDRLPAIDQARTMCKIFKVNIEWFLTGNGLKRLDDKQQPSPLLDKFNQLCPDQQQIIELMVDQLSNKPKSSENKENKPLTARPENVGGGGCLTPLSDYRRRQSDGPASKEFIEAVQQDYEDSK